MPLIGFALRRRLQRRTRPLQATIADKITHDSTGRHNSHCAGVVVRITTAARLTPMTPDPAAPAGMFTQHSAALPAPVVIRTSSSNDCTTGDDGMVDMTPETPARTLI
ncbi:hypothetical protein MTOK_22660 [Mycolicibacterium tokaiense]|nr:hypothetical protein MTOK_22660 [Mycolicibacterium tokaiense]